MATTTKALARGAFATSSATLYTVPSATTTVVTDILIANTTGSAGTFTLALNGVSIATAVPVGANDSTSIQLKQVLSATQTITGLASATSINFHISGVEIA
jgi:ABC-type xylose transport system substrate-binding protein